MVTKVIIKNNEKSPLNYLPDLDNFSNGSEFEFKSGVNIIVGENGCGKTTILEDDAATPAFLLAARTFFTLSKYTILLYFNCILLTTSDVLSGLRLSVIIIS